MADRVPRPNGSGEVNSLDAIRPTPAKASLRVNGEQFAINTRQADVAPVNANQSPLRVLIAESIRQTSSQKAVAADMQIDPAQLTRQLQTGHLTVERLEALAAPVLAAIGMALQREFGPLVDPKASARRSIERIEDELRTLRQFVDHVV